MTTRSVLEPAVQAPVGGTRGESAGWRKWPRLDALLAGALSCVWAVNALRYLSAPHPSDQMNYMKIARVLPVGTDQPEIVHQYTRLGVIVPMRLAIEVFGFSQAAYYALPLLGTLMLLLSTYALGAMLVNRAVGLAAAAVTVANGFIVVEASMPLPDVLASGQITTAAALALALRRRLPAVTATTARRVVTLLAIGALLGWSYLTREVVVFLWPVVLVLLIRRIAWRELALIAAPAALFLAAELVYGFAVFGDPLARMRAVVAHGGGEVPPAIAAGYQNLPLSTYLERLPHALLGREGGSWLVALLAIGLIGGVAAARRLWPLLLWFLLLWVPLTLLGGVLDPSAPKLRLQLTRYWYPLFPAIFVAAFGALWLGVAWSMRRASRRGQGGTRTVAVVASLCALLVGGITVWRSYDDGWADDPRLRANGATQLEELRSWLAAHPEQTRVWLDRRTQPLAQLYIVSPFGRPVWTGRFPILKPGTTPAVGAAVVVYSGTSPLCPLCRREAEAWFGGRPPRVPAGWRLEYASGDRQLLIYKVERVSEPLPLPPSRQTSTA